MKFTLRPTYLIIALALALSACSQDDPVPARETGAGTPIAFQTSLPVLTSRADVVTKKNLPYFYVTAFDFDDPTLISGGVMDTLFGNQIVNIVDPDIKNVSPYCCWPDQTKESHVVTFFGFYPGTDEVGGAELVNNSTATTVDYRLKGFRVAPDIADQVDFITAYNTGSMAANLFSGVTLPFFHQLSRIEIKACGAHKSCDIEIAGVRIGGAGVEGTFEFSPVEGGGAWSPAPTRGIVEYVYRKGDTIVTCGNNHRIVKESAVSIMGAKRADGNDNCAMLIPSTYAMWDSDGDPSNGANQMYISVLIRVTDVTLTAGKNPKDPQRYPYTDLSQGTGALNTSRVYMAVDKASGVVSTRLYKNGDSYFTDSLFSDRYILPATEEIKEFGWAAIPVTGSWAPGNIYTYTLDYTYGVGLHDPEVTTSAPGAGDPVISDRVGLTYSVKEWNEGGGSEFPVPGS